jgi:hypothetical protein
MADFHKTAYNLTTKLQELVSQTGLQNNFGLATDKLAEAIKDYLNTANHPTFYEVAQAVVDSNTENNCLFQVQYVESAGDLGWVCHGVVIRRALIATRNWTVTPDLKVTEQ